MQNSQLKLRIVWPEWSPFAAENDGDGDDNDVQENSIVSEQYYPGNILFDDLFGDFVSSLEEKYGVCLDTGGDDIFYELDIADEPEVGSVADIAQKVLSDLEQYLKEQL